jgi:hypothetical protein
MGVGSRAYVMLSDAKRLSRFTGRLLAALGMTTFNAFRAGKHLFRVLSVPLCLCVDSYWLADSQCG